MQRLAVLFCGMMLGAGAAMAQDAAGTVNSMTTNPTVNQELTGSMGTTTGQPNDVTPGSMNQPNGLTPVTSTMTGSGNIGAANQPSATGSASKPAVPANGGSGEPQAKKKAGTPAASGSKRPAQKPSTATQH